jgi:hypothetical protein
MQSTELAEKFANEQLTYVRKLVLNDKKPNTEKIAAVTKALRFIHSIIRMLERLGMTKTEIYKQYKSLETECSQIDIPTIVFQIGNNSSSSNVNEDW